MNVSRKGVRMNTKIAKLLWKYALNLSQAQSVVRTVLKKLEAHLVCNPFENLSKYITHIVIDILVDSSVQRHIRQHLAVVGTRTVCSHNLVGVRIFWYIIPLYR